MDKEKLQKQYKSVKDELLEQIRLLHKAQRKIDSLIKKCHKLEDKIYG
jgi:hypothetical protein